MVGVISSPVRRFPYMQQFDLEGWFTLLTGFAIFIMGLRIFWLDPKNRMYRAFLLTTFFLFFQSLLFFYLDLTTAFEFAKSLRIWQESCWNIAIVFIVITLWLYTKQIISRPLSRIENFFFITTLIISPIFIFLQAFTSYGHGQLILNNNNKWAIAIYDPILIDYLRMLWSLLIYSVSIYFSFLPFKKSNSRLVYWLRGAAFVVFSVIMIGTFVQNYIVTIFFDGSSVLNESVNVAVGGLFTGLMIINFQRNDLNSDYVIPNLLKIMTNWFILTDKNFNIHRVNTAFLEAMGGNIGYWRGQPIQAVFNRVEWEICRKKLQSLKENETIDYEFEIHHQGKTYYLLFTITPVNKIIDFFLFKNNKIKAYAFVGTNLSQFKASENKTKAYAKELEASVQALESFAFIASHDLKEPIRNIGSFATLIKRRLGENMAPEIADYIGFIEKSAKGMNELVHSIMDISSIDRKGLKFERIDLNELLSNKYIHLKTLFDNSDAAMTIGELPILMCDAKLLQQLFRNLIENSIKYNKSPNPNIAISSYVSGKSNSVQVIFEDNGIGIEEEYREQVFQMFKRLHSRQVYEGTGVGLAICKRIMDLHQGSITIKDTKTNTGVAFVLSFPYNPQSQP